MNKMKKIILSIFIVGFSLLGFAQDRVLIDEDFDSFTPTGWTVDGSATPSSVTWTQSGYPIIASDVVALEEYLTSPNIELDQNYTYQISFKFAQYGATVVNGDLEVLVSYDGTTWDPTDANAASIMIKNDATQDTWVTEAGHGVTPPAATGNVKFAFRFFADGSEMEIAVDNFIVQVDSAADNTPPHPVGWENLVEYKFEAGFNGWAIVSQSGASAVETWEHESLCKVGEDTDEVQTVLLSTPKIAVPDVEHTDFDISADFYSFLNRNGDGVRLYVTTQDDWVTLNNPIDLTYNINNNTNLNSIASTLIEGTHYNAGDSMQFVFEFTNTPAGSVDFYLEHFTFELVFDEAAINGDTEYLDLTGTVQPDSVISPLHEKYGMYTAEGFWQVQPDNWAIDTTGFDGAIVKGTSYNNHDYFAYFTADADIDAMEVSMTTDAIAYNVPDVGATYMLNFEWATEPTQNAGDETDPNITGAQYNYGDFVVEISTNGGSNWTEIWWEDDEDTLNETTSDADRNNGNLITNAWTNYGDYMADGTIWYATSVDISNYLTGTGNLLVRFNYSTINVDAGDFYLDNFYVMKTTNPEFDMDGTMPLSVDKTAGDYFIDYSNIPISQLDNPVNFGAIVFNYGLTSFPDGQLNVTVNTNAFGYTAVTDDSWTSGNKYWEVTNFGAQYNGGLTVEAGQTYDIGYSLNVNGIAYNDAKSFDVTTDTYAKVDLSTAASFVTPFSINDGTSGSVGSVFEFTNSDVVVKVAAALSSAAETEAYLTIIKLDEPTDATGTKVFTSSRVIIESTGAANYIFNVGVELEGGNFYAFMINLTDDTDVLIATENTFDGQIVRGNADALYNDNLEENLYIGLEIIPNEGPVIVTEFPNNRVVVEAVDPASQDSVVITIIATDANGDDLTWPAGARIFSPEWLAGWMNFNDSKGDTLLLTGKPDADDLGTTNVTVVVEDEKGAQTSYAFDIEVVTELAYFEPDYTADIRQFTQIDDELGEETTEFWTRAANLATINGEVGKKQKDRLISTPIMIPAASKAVGESYRLEFEWKAGSATADSKYFIGGIAGALGTEDTDGGANYADVSLVVSTDNGGTWSAPIWKEDDAALLAPATDGIYQGAKWGYNGNQWYNSVLDLDAYAGEIVYFAFVYESKNVAVAANNKFEIKNFKVLGNKDVDVDIFIHTDFTSIPTQHFDWTTGLTYNVQLINDGRSIPDGATYSLSFPIQGYYEEFDIDASTFALSDTVWRNYTFVPDSGIMTSYTLTATLDVDLNAGNNSDNKAINVANSTMNKDKAATVAEETLAQYDGVGTIYPLAVNDLLEKVTVNFATASSHFSVSVLQLETADATTGKVIAATTDNWATGSAVALVTTVGSFVIEFEEPIELEAGYYAVMVSQIVDGEVVTLMRSDRDQDKLGFIRGNDNSLYNEGDDKGFLDMVINFTANVAPDFVAISVANEEVYQGQTFSRTILTKNLNTYGTIFIEEVIMPQWLSFNDNGDGTATITGDVADAEPGDYTIEIRAHDRFNIATKVFVVTVYANPAPVFSTTPPSVAFEDAAFTYTASGYDVLGDNTTITAVQLPAWLTATASGTDLVLTGTPLTANIGNNVVKLAITDIPFGNVTHQTFDLYVYANDAPEFVSTPNEDAFINMEYVYYIVANDANGNDGLVVTESGVPTWLTFTDLNNGKATLTGTPTVAGTDDIVLTVTDPSGATDVQSFSVTVNTNGAPVFTSTPVTVAKEDTNYVYFITATDADGDYLYFSTEVIPNWMTFTVTGNGVATLQGIPTQNNVGDNVVSILVGDGNNTVLQNFTVVVAEVNDAPLFKSTAVETATVGETYNYMVEGWDEEGATLTYDGELPAWLTITQTNDGMAIVSGTPSENVIGDIAITLTVNDGNSTTDQVYNLSVSGVLDIVNGSNNAVELYPNPTSGVFNLKYAEGADVYVFSISGKVVRQIENASNLEVIDISEFNAGSYFIKIVSEGNVITKPLNLIK